MKLGCIALACITIVLFAEEGTCGIKRNSTGSRRGPFSRNNVEEDDDFVPYQGERFNTFDWMLFRAMGKKYAGNLLMSPISIKMALVLLYEGAQDQTAHELATVMQLPVGRSATRETFSSILQSFRESSTAYKLNFGTQIYIDSNILTRQRYEAIVKTFYDTDVINANFSDTHSIAQRINSWVSNVTEGNIEKMIDDEASIKDSLMLIMNAIFFKGSWRRRYFDAANTKVEKFYTSTNQTVDVPFMKTFGRFYYSESSEMDAKIIRIPYEGHKFAMYLVLPNTLNGLEKLANQINPFILARHVWLMQDLPVDISIPKFKFEFSSHLEEALRELGIRDIFDDTATLTGVARVKRTSKHLKVSDVIQKTGILVNENGTMAYAATEVQLGNKIEDETFHANHPFLFYIEDESTGTIIYVGKIENPAETASDTVPQVFPPKISEDMPNAAPPGLNAKDRDNFFNIDFLQALNGERPGNVISSPASVKMVLTMLAEAAGGKTREELISYLRLPRDNAKIRQIAQRIFKPLKRNESGTEIDTATRFWVHQRLQVENEYKDTLQTHYKGDVASLNFENSMNSTRVINNWVRQAARNKVSSALADRISPDTCMVLTSVIYFKGRWLKSFDKTKTKLQCFHTPDGSCRTTYFMQHESMYRYAVVPSLNAQVLEIPYSDRKTSMLAIMPIEMNNDPYLRVLSKDLSYVPVSTLLSTLSETDATIHIPKFTIESKLDLKPTLKRLGIENIFEPSANLTKMVQASGLQVTSALQNAKIEIDEDGTLAVADTEIIYALLSLNGNDVTLDRPFIFMIVDLQTETTLFAGRFLEPT